MSEYNRFGELIGSADETLHGHAKADVISFIDNNNGRYYEIFKRNEDRRFFLNMNWAAFFLSVYWLFYRKMYMIGLIFIVVSGILGSLTAYAAISAFKSEILAIREGYELQTMSCDDIPTDDFVDYSEMMQGTRELDMQMRRLQAKIFFWGVLPMIILGLLFGGVADCLYRNHIIRKIGDPGAGGVSKGAVFGALALMLLSNSITEVINRFFIEALIQ